MEKFAQIIIQNLMPLIQSDLECFGEFEPLMGLVNVDGSFIECENIEISDSADLESEIIRLLKKLKNLSFEKDAEIYGICYNAEIDNTESHKVSDTIVFHIKSRKNTDTLFYYFPYELSAKNEITFGESYAELLKE